jgi:predicted  nucleic acid-binding Zn-ribbon protein
LLAASAGYAFWQVKERQQMLDQALVQATSVENEKQTLETDLKKTREEFDAARKAHEDALSLKGQELDTAIASLKEKTEELAKESDKIRDMQTQVDASAVLKEEKERLANELKALKTTSQETEGQINKAKEDVERLTQELANRKTAPAQPATPPIAIAIDIDSESTNKPSAAQSQPNQERSSVERMPKKKTSPFAWLRLGRHENGKNKGRWYFVAPDGFTSPLYASSEMAVRAAELRAGHPQPDLEKVGAITEVRYSGK